MLRLLLSLLLLRSPHGRGGLCEVVREVPRNGVGGLPGAPLRRWRPRTSRRRRTTFPLLVVVVAVVVVVVGVVVVLFAALSAAGFFRLEAPLGTFGPLLRFYI